jgi:hypothetical protein
MYSSNVGTINGPLTTDWYVEKTPVVDEEEEEDEEDVEEVDDDEAEDGIPNINLL